MASALCLRRGRFFLANPNPCCVVRRVEDGALQHARRAHHCCVKLPAATACKGNAWSRLELEGSAYARSGLLLRRWFSDRGRKYYTANKNTSVYIAAVAVFVLGLSYAAVPLYRLYCQASGYGGTVSKAKASEKVEKMQPVRERELTIRFAASTSAGMRWQFKPHQREIKLVPGETALAFYSAHNPTSQAITGISTYNVIPFDAGQYFNKIQCFCFEEQRLNPGEEVDMPVFFYIDPEFSEDPAMAKVDEITLSYTFFEAREGEDLPLPTPSHQLGTP